MKIKKALCLLVAFAVVASIGAMPVFADEIGTDFDFAEAPNELAGGTDTADDFLADVPGLGEITLPDTTTETVSDEALLDMVSGMEFKASSIRFAISLLGVESEAIAYGFTEGEEDEPRSIYEISDESIVALAESFGLNDMAAVADWIAKDLLPYKVMPMELLPSKANSAMITVTSANDASNGTFTVKYGDDEVVGPITVGSEADIKNLEISPRTGYDIESALLTQGTKRISDGSSKFSVTTVLEIKEHKVLISDQHLKNKKEDVTSTPNGVYYVPGSQTIPADWEGENEIKIAVLAISVTTTPKTPGKVEIQEEGDPTSPEPDGGYTYNGQTASNMSTLADLINGDIDNGTIKYGGYVKFGYNGDAISNVNVKYGQDGGSDSVTVTKDSVQFKLKDETVNVKITFKKKSGGVKFDDGGEKFPDHVTAVTVNGKPYKTLSELNKHLKTLYVGTTVDLVFTLADNYKIAGSDHGLVDSEGRTVKGIELTEPQEKITLTITYTGKPTVTISKYAVSEVEAPTEVDKVPTTNGQMIIAEVSNADVLGKDTLNGASLTITGNVTSEDNEEYKGQSITKTSDVGDKNPNYVGLIFVPKTEGGFQFTYNVGVTATLNYGSGESASNTRAYTIGK